MIPTSMSDKLAEHYRKTGDNEWYKLQTESNKNVAKMLRERGLGPISTNNDKKSEKVIQSNENK